MIQEAAAAARATEKKALRLRCLVVLYSAPSEKGEQGEREEEEGENHCASAWCYNSWSMIVWRRTFALFFLLLLVTFLCLCRFFSLNSSFDALLTQLNAAPFIETTTITTSEEARHFFSIVLWIVSHHDCGDLIIYHILKVLDPYFCAA